jgi:glutaredoxin
MRKFGLTIGFVILFVFNVLNGYAVQQDSLFLYTKPGCSNCHATKQIFNESGISYIEKSLDIDINAAEMLRKIAAAGYKKSIYLPVIFINDKLYHPAYKTDKGLVSLPLQDVVDTILGKFKKGELNLPAYNASKNRNEAQAAEVTSDCEVKTSPVYLICSTFEKEDDAKKLMNKLISEGYTYAGIVYSQKQFKVFSKFFYDQTQANADLKTMKKDYSKAYLLDIP